MNEIPQAGPARESYIISVTQGVKREGDRALNVQRLAMGLSGWVSEPFPEWNWADNDYRLYEPEVVMYSWGWSSGDAVLRWKTSIGELPSVTGSPHIIKRTTGGGRTIPDYEPLPLERGE